MRSAPSAEEIRELLSFLPALETPGRVFAEPEPGPAASGLNYLPDVHQFFRVAGRGWWDDPEYQPARASAMLADSGAVERASLSDIRGMLTYCVRGERFCEGHWEALLRSGSIVRLLRRLQELADEMG